VVERPRLTFELGCHGDLEAVTVTESREREREGGPRKWSWRSWAAGGGTDEMEVGGGEELGCCAGAGGRKSK
jgi:hypothetical protein